MDSLSRARTEKSVYGGGTQHGLVAEAVGQNSRGLGSIQQLSDAHCASGVTARQLSKPTPSQAVTVHLEDAPSPFSRLSSSVQGLGGCDSKKRQTAGQKAWTVG